MNKEEMKKMKTRAVHTQIEGNFHKELYNKVIIGLTYRRIVLTMLKNAIGANDMLTYHTYP